MNETLSGYSSLIYSSKFILYDSIYDQFSCTSIDNDSSYVLCNVSGGDDIFRNISNCITITYIINLYKYEKSYPEFNISLAGTWYLRIFSNAIDDFVDSSCKELGSSGFQLYTLQ